jgi:hypothetical protein
VRSGREEDIAQPPLSSSLGGAAMQRALTLSQRNPSAQSAVERQDSRHAPMASVHTYGEQSNGIAWSPRQTPSSPEQTA